MVGNCSGTGGMRCLVRFISLLEHGAEKRKFLSVFASGCLFSRLDQLLSHSVAIMSVVNPQRIVNATYSVSKTTGDIALLGDDRRDRIGSGIAGHSG